MSRPISNPGLARLLAERGLEMADLAALCGCHRNAPRAWARGRVSPILESRMALHLGMTVADLRRACGIKAPQRSAQ